MFKEKEIPLYYQLETILRTRISSGDLRPKAPVPTEEVLAQAYRVSRITVRRALFSLEQDGLIVRKRGKGTFVVEKPLSLAPPHLSGSIEDLILMGEKTVTKIINFGLSHAPIPVRDSLGIDEGSEVVRIERLRFLSEGNPLSYLINYLPLSPTTLLKA